MRVLWQEQTGFNVEKSAGVRFPGHQRPFFDVTDSPSPTVSTGSHLIALVEGPPPGE